MNLCVLGAQWGDEGKGKIVDLLTPNFSVVARYQGGHNAGHTVVVGMEEFPRTLRELDEQYPREYRDLIRAYFDKLLREESR